MNILAIVFVVLCLIALWGGVMWAIYYDSLHPNWYKPKDRLYANVKGKQARRTPDA